MESNDNDGDDGASDGVPSSRPWVLSWVANQKLRLSPALGEEYIMRGELMVSGGGADDVDGTGDDIDGTGG